MGRANLAERTRRVRLLLDSLDEVYESEPTGDLSTIHGAGDDSYVLCVDCSRYSNLGRKVCPVCDGHGYRPARAGDRGGDAYTLLTDRLYGREPESPPRLMTPDERERDLERLRAMALARQGVVAASDMLWWEKRISSLERQGSYRELRRVLQLLGPKGRAAVRRREPGALAVVASIMRGRIRVPKWMLG